MNKSLPSLPQKKQKQKHVFATAIYDYHPQVSGDLRFSAGDRILVKERINDDWWAGEVVTIGEDSVQDGLTGMFPRSHVHVESW
ncbi:hypothetical protein DL89DRAFT_264121 [Linderina pennispora]|uniref:SH3 domain-containing protein n=1 Tax=Linderina pennispora TaxID=61395 RepID=A0A1Y1WM55_9FUNG|nr:uncharacterized protein DL89DRAFT_264121 [Linderina pennispora]ORX74174.1 hypothetical protein DL89DRAFT_264121 [Linderina pennispora]